jgi:hypothetical protein
VTGDGAEHLRRLRALFDAAMDRPEAERRVFLDGADEWSAALRLEVSALISASEQTDVTPPGLRQASDSAPTR